MKMGKLEKLFVNNAGHSESVARQTEQMLRHVTVQPGQKYLDVGCGNGAAPIYVAQTFDLNVTGVDVLMAGNCPLVTASSTWCSVIR